jgi:glycosyltransferase involved in cell wall biosynthesis
MEMKADVIMWAKNGASMLPIVLKRADEVIPREIVRKKIFVDDHSTDESRKIAKDFNWIVYPNEKGGIANGINTALKNVDSEYFISLEQDLVLAKDWFEKIPKHLENPRIVSAQGWKLPNHPILRKISEFALEKANSTTLHSIDNNFFKTKPVKDYLGEIPQTLRYIAADSYVRMRLEKQGYQFLTDPTVISLHLRCGGLAEEIRRSYLYGLFAPRQKEEFMDEIETKRAFKIAILSPIRGLEIAIKKQCPQAIYYYPLIRLSFLRGALKR